LAAVAGIGANIFANAAIADAFGGGLQGAALADLAGFGNAFNTFSGSLALNNPELRDTLFLGLAAPRGSGFNAALNTYFGANALGALTGNDFSLSLSDAVLANQLIPQRNGNGNLYYSSGYYRPQVAATLDATTYLPTLPTTYLPAYLPTTPYLPSATTYIPSVSATYSSYWPDYTTSLVGSPYVGLGVGSAGCWVNGVWMASCFV
jgi:hypothetical protein